MVVFGGNRTFVELAVNLCEEEGEPGFGVAVAGAFNGEVDVFDSLFVFFLRNSSLNHGGIELVALGAGEVALRQVVDKLVECCFSFGVAFFSYETACQENGTFVASTGAGEL